LMRMAVAGCMLAVALAGCSSDDDPAPATATLGTAPPVTPTTDPYAVPAVIDEAYVNRVLEALDAAVGEVVRMVVRERTIPPEAVDRLKTLYMGEFLQIQLDLFSNDVRESFRQYKPEPGNKKTLVNQLLSGAASCIFARVERDYSAVAARPNLGVTTQWIGLRPLDRSKDPSKYNPTPWIYSYDGFQQDGSAPSNPCAT
ncbi:MAG: hypothetical protein LC808_39265, partial [Actinobacteria bacterium]|nr:hypothetical protein [Actinomycetota bacterium]